MRWDRTQTSIMTEVFRLVNERRIGEDTPHSLLNAKSGKGPSVDVDIDLSPSNLLRIREMNRKDIRRISNCYREDNIHAKITQWSMGNIKCSCAQVMFSLYSKYKCFIYATLIDS